MQNVVLIDGTEAAAYRQAGHAVAALYHQLSFERLSLEPDESLGEFFLERSTLAGWESLSKEQQEAELILILAGELAQKKAKGRKEVKRMGIEAMWVVEVLGNLEGSEEIAKAYYWYLSLKAQALLDQPYVWEVTQKIAQQLLENRTLSFHHIKQVWHRADAQPREYILKEAASPDPSVSENGQTTGIQYAFS
jgi:hypothetical protein